MKVITLTFAYDISKLFEIGRFWAKDVYIDKDFISDYSAASYATFLHTNPDLQLHLYTDDIDLIREKLNQYNVNLKNVVYHDYSEKLKSYEGKLKYSFDILHDFIIEQRSNSEYTVKIDCDLSFRNKIPMMDNTSKDILVWKYERMLFNGDPRMGEIKSSTLSVGNINYKIFNVGLLGIPPTFEIDELDDVGVAQLFHDGLRAAPPDGGRAADEVREHDLHTRVHGHGHGPLLRVRLGPQRTARVARGDGAHWR